MNNLKCGDYVWCTIGSSCDLLGKICKITIGTSDSVKKTKHTSRPLLQLQHSNEYQSVNIKNISPFRETFFEHAENYVRKHDGLLILERVLKEIKWTDGHKLLADLLRPKELPVKRARSNFPCEICQKLSGPQIFCKQCNSSSVHKKKCAGLLNDNWMCNKCKGSHGKIEPDSSEKIDPAMISTPEPLDLSRNASITILDTNVTISKIIDESRKDKVLHNILMKRQKDFNDIHAEVKKMNEGLALFQKPEEIRRNKYKIAEFLRNQSDILSNDLIDQLHCAHISGFESTKRLQKLYGDDVLLLEKHRTAQKEIALGLLGSNILSKLEPVVEETCSKFDKFMERSNSKGLFAKLSNTVEGIKNMKIEENKAVPTVKILYGIAKVIIDGTLANCEYTPGQQIEHVGGGTDPKLLGDLLNKIKQKYKFQENVSTIQS